MGKFWQNFNFESGDTWPVGGFQIRPTEGVERDLIPLIVEHFDIPCWPELVGLGASEELVGFWTTAFKEWEAAKNSEPEVEKLLLRPGFAHFHKVFKATLLPVVKGQMIGPVTLLWALKKDGDCYVSEERVVSFVAQAFQYQMEALAEVGKRVIISLDEPCAFLVPECQKLWEETLEIIRFRQYHDGAVAMHCCGTPSPHWLELDWDVVHFDILELSQVMRSDPEKWKKAWAKFFSEGRWLAAGVMPSSQLALQMGEESLLEGLNELKSLFPILRIDQTLLSTTCGLGALTKEDLEKQLKFLGKIQNAFHTEAG